MKQVACFVDELTEDQNHLPISGRTHGGSKLLKQIQGNFLYKAITWSWPTVSPGADSYPSLHDKTTKQVETLYFSAVPRLFGPGE